MNSQPAESPEGDGDEIYLPFTARRKNAVNDQLADDLEEVDDDALTDDDASRADAIRMRPPPKELSRADRGQWRRIELARINRAAQSAASHRAHPASTSWSGGFIKSPPRGLGRKGRRAWLAAEQEATTRWWAQRRASNQDIDARAAGAAVLALVIGIAVVAALIVHRSDPTGSATASHSTAAGTTTTSATASSSPAQRLPAPVVPGATGSVAVNSGNAAVGMTPTVAPPVAGRWQPTPAGGVPPITPTPPAAVDPGTVPLVASPTGPVTAADHASATAVVTSWLARTCPSSWRDRFGTNLIRGKPLETAAAWKVDDPALDTVGAALWRSEAVAHQQTRRCGNIAVTVSPDQPLTAHGGFVLFSADRVVTSTAAQLPATVEHLSGARRVVAADGKWLVDIPVVGG